MAQNWHENDPKIGISQQTRDVFSIVYAVASIYSLAYNIIRPQPEAWGGYLGGFIGKIDEISNRVNTLTQSVNAVLSEIQKLPSIVGKVMDAQLMKDRMRYANGLVLALSDRYSSKDRLIDERDVIAAKIIEIQASIYAFDSWYSENPQGPLSYLLTLSPILVPTAILYDTLELIRWEVRQTTPINDYPVEKIDNHRNWSSFKKAKTAIKEILDFTEKTLSDNTPIAEEFCPYFYGTTPSSDRFFSEFKNGKFVGQHKFKGRLPPNPRLLSLCSGSWLEKDPSNPELGAAVYHSRLRYQGAWSKTDASIEVAPGQSNEEIKAISQKICNAKCKLRQISMLSEIFPTLQEQFIKINEGQVWQSSGEKT